jgi:hypothetical protein
MWPAYGLTPARFDSLKKVIAADSAKSAAYQRLITPRAVTGPRN